MALEPFLYDDYYQLKGDASAVSMDLIFGDLGQSPDYQVTLDGTALIPGGPNDGTTSVKNFPLGKDVDLIDKNLVITGLITDMPETSDFLKLNFRVEGGKTRLDKQYSVKATTGDHVDISLTVRFYKKNG